MIWAWVVMGWVPRLFVSWRHRPGLFDIPW